MLNEAPTQQSPASAGGPEPIAPLLGHLADPQTSGPFEDIRLELVDRLIESHAAKRLDHAGWLAAWESAVDELCARLITEAESHLRAAAQLSRCPRRQLEASLPNPQSAELLRNRLLAEGIQLERLHTRGSERIDERARGAQLEAAWASVLVAAAGERARSRAVAARIAEWRRPWQPLIAAAVVLFALALVAALWIGGVLPAPTWFDPVVDWFWGLPWQ